MNLQTISNKLRTSWKIYSRPIKVLVTLILLILIFLRVDVGQSLALFQNINYLILIPIVLYLPALLISSFKWNILLDSELGLFKLAKIYWISNFFSNFLPTTIGGDSYRVAKVSTEVGVKRAVLSTIMDRFFGMFAIVLITACFSLTILNLTNNIYLSLLPALFLFAALAAFLFFINFDIKIRSNYLGVKDYIRSHFGNTFILILMSMLYFVVGAISLWVYYLMFGYALDFRIILAFYGLIQLVNAVPLSINSLGLRESATIYLFALAGVPAEVSLSVAILSRLVGLLQTSIGGVIYLLRR